jgi:hypothetical protein
LCGSSARKLRRGGVNLLGGRAVTRNLDAFSCAELGGAFDPDFSLQWGLLPWVQLEKENAADILDSYVNTYIKEGGTCLSPKIFYPASPMYSN